MKNLEKMNRSDSMMLVVQGAGSTEPLFDDFPLAGDLLPNRSLEEQLRRGAPSTRLGRP
jgi:hypothetical protein